MSYATPADCRAFSSFAAVTAKSDSELQALIDRAELIVNAWTRNDFNDDPGKTVNVNGSGSKFLYLPKRFRSLSAVRFLDRTLNQAQQDFTQPSLEDLFLRGNGWYIEALVVFPGGVENIELEGDAGYASVPDNVNKATCKVVEGYVLREKDGKFHGKALKKERIGDYNYELAGADGSASLDQEIKIELPAEARMLLRDFKKPLRPRVARHLRPHPRHVDTHDGRHRS